MAHITNSPNLLLLRILFFRILLKAVLGVLLDLLAPIDEVVDEEVEEEDDGDAQDGEEGEGHPHLARGYSLMFDFQKPGTRPAGPC